MNKVNTHKPAKPDNPISQQIYRELPADMFTQANLSASPAPALLKLNQELLAEMALSSTWFESENGLAVLSGNAVNPQIPTIALAYSGHQFGHWVPVLGDGRAHMLGQMVTDGGVPIDVQTKGSGRTAYSRGGDGRATLGSVLREYMVSEAMAGLGIPTTRSLAAVSTGETVMRETPLPGAIVVRTALSHVRVGTFQFASASSDSDSVRNLADYSIKHYFPELTQQPNRYLKLFESIIHRQVSLITQWMLVGFIHGVMNTDNTSIVGETIDYGPCAFMDEFHPGKVFSSIDQFGRYAWNQQPNIVYWNLTQLSRTLLPLLDPSETEAQVLAGQQLDHIGELFQRSFHTGMGQKLGVQGESSDIESFVEQTFTLMTENSIDFTVFFDRLTQVAGGSSGTLLTELFDHPQKAENWLSEWRKRRSASGVDPQAMRRVNPAVIARNHRVEQAIAAAEQDNNLEPFHRLCLALQNPYEVKDADLELQVPPLPQERVTKTYCGT